MDHVIWLGRGGNQDWTLLRFALDNGYVFVTNNRRDFLRAYAGLEIHDGLVIIVPTVQRADQMRLFDLALDRMAELPDTVNLLIEVQADGEVTVRPWPGNAGDAG